MRITEFNATLEVNKGNDGYSNNLYINIKDGRVNVSRPYIDHSPDEAIVIESFIMRFIETFKGFNDNIDSVNKDLKLEQYAPIAQEEPKASVSLEDTTFG